MKYIDADKLIAEIKALKSRKGFLPLENTEITEAYMARGVQFTCDDIVNLITTLQQKQPECIYGRTLEEREKYCKFCSAACEARIEMVDLEKFTEKIKTFLSRYKYPEIVSIKGAMTFMARMFYQYPNVARQWYKQLPKATID